jgi:hypothetical protein
VARCEWARGEGEGEGDVECEVVGGPIIRFTTVEKTMHAELRIEYDGEDKHARAALTISTTCPPIALPSHDVRSSRRRILRQWTEILSWRGEGARAVDLVRAVVRE